MSLKRYNATMLGTAVLGDVSDEASTAWEGVSTSIADGASSLWSGIKSGLGTIADGVRSAYNYITDGISNTATGIVNLFGSATAAIAGLWRGRRQEEGEDTEEDGDYSDDPDLAYNTDSSPNTYYMGLTTGDASGNHILPTIEETTPEKAILGPEAGGKNKPVVYKNVTVTEAKFGSDSKERLLELQKLYKETEGTLTLSQLEKVKEYSTQFSEIDAKIADKKAQIDQIKAAASSKISGDNLPGEFFTGLGLTGGEWKPADPSYINQLEMEIKELQTNRSKLQTNYNQYVNDSIADNRLNAVIPFLDNINGNNPGVRNAVRNLLTSTDPNIISAASSILNDYNIGNSDTGYSFTYVTQRTVSVPQWEGASTNYSVSEVQSYISAAGFYQGMPYKLGGTGANTNSSDCSHLTHGVQNKMGMEYPYTPTENFQDLVRAGYFKEVTKQEAETGKTVILYPTLDTKGKYDGHITLFLSKNPNGSLNVAQSVGGKNSGVRFEGIDNSLSYYRDNGNTNLEGKPFSDKDVKYYTFVGNPGGK